MKIIMYFVLVWSVLSAGGYLIGTIFFDTNALQRFVDEGRTVYAAVTGKEPENHGLVQYSYEVDGQTYFGKGRAGGVNPGFDELAKGDPVVVFYDPAAPGSSYLGYPQYEIAENRSLRWVAAVTVPIIPMVALIALYFVITRTRDVGVVDRK